MLTHKSLKARALAKPGVKAEYERLDEEFALLDQFLKARMASGLTQADIAERIGTTQSAVARLEASSGKHSPSLATLRKYASAIGCRVELKLVKQVASRKTKLAISPATKTRRAA
jgi:transcriptional regulator with XRE-family HTH domain